MTIRVTIARQGVYDTYGRPLTVGATYSLDDAYALSLISNGGATDTDNVTRVLPNDPFAATHLVNAPTGLPTVLQATALLGNTGQNLVVALGDSITARCDTASAGAQTALSTSFIAWGSAYLAGRVQWKSAGVSGNTTAQMLARYATDVTPYPSRWLSLFGGGNDIAADITSATIIANLGAILTLAFSEGRTVLLGTVYPFGSFTTTARRGVLARVNQWVRQQASDRVIVVDYYGSMVDASGVIRTSYLVDTIHPTPLGASIMGRLLSAALTTLLPPLPNLLSSSQWDADNTFSAGQMVGDFASGVSSFSVGAGVTGTGPRGWGWTRGGAAIVATVSKAARSGGIIAADFARGEITTTGANDDYLRLERAINFRLWSSGGTANTIRRFYVPGTGAQYEVLVDGAFAAGADPTAAWPQNIGDIFVDGSATLICVPPIVIGSILKLSVECNISSVSVGLVQPEAIVLVRTNAAVTICVASSMGYDAASGTMPAAAESGAGLVLCTPESPPVPSTFDLAATSASAGPALVVRLNLYVRNSALATVDWGRATVRVR